MLPQIPKDQWPDLMDYILDVSVKILNNPHHEVIKQLQDAFTKGDVKGMEAALDAYERALIERENKSKLEGMEAGKREDMEAGKRETAKRMLELGAEKDFVIKATGLSASEVEALLNS